MRKKNKIFKHHLVIMFLIMVMASSVKLSFAQAPDGKKWEAPESASELANPYKNDPKAPLEGMKIFSTICAVCHGEAGKGNGPASAALNPRPANFLAAKVRNESDGAIFWKMSEGNPPMAPYKTLLTENQRWQLVAYIRKLEEKK